MASIINANSSGGLISVGDTSGQLQLQTVGTTAITVDSSQNVGIGTTSPTGTGRLVVKLAGSSSVQGFAVQASGNDSFLTIYNNASVHTFEATYSSTGSYQPIAFITSSTERMRITTAGYVTTPYQPAFSAYAAGGNITGTSGGGTAVVWNTVLANVSSSYSSSTGIFTAPVAGVYYFSCMGMAATISGNPDIQLFIKKNGSNVASSNPPTGNSNAAGINFSASVLLSLSLGDTVSVSFYANSGSQSLYAAGGAYNNFSGFLIG